MGSRAGPAPQLGYGSRPPRLMRLLDRGFKPFVILIACILAAWLLPRTLRHVQLIRLSSRCMNHHMDSDAVACEFNSNRETGRVQRDPRYESLGRSRGLIPEQWRALHQHLYGSPLRSCGTAFVGARHSFTSGSKRLVTVDVVQTGFYDEPLRLVSRLYDVNSKRSGPRTLNVDVLTLPHVQPLRCPYPTRVYAAVRNPEDGSRMTIAVEVDGPKGEPPRRYIVDCLVRDNDVIMATRNAPEVEVWFPTDGEEQHSGM